MEALLFKRGKELVSLFNSTYRQNCRALKAAMAVYHAPGSRLGSRCRAQAMGEEGPDSIEQGDG